MKQLPIVRPKLGLLAGVLPLLISQVAFGTTTNYRSIGTAPDYGTGTTVNVTNGSAVVTGVGGTAWKTANRGRGDKFTATGDGVTSYTVKSVDSETQLTLTSNYTGTTDNKLYTIARKFRGGGVGSTALLDWEKCIDNTVACDDVLTSSLSDDQRIEVGILYKDSDFVAPALVIENPNSSATDAIHKIILTADPGNRHYGIPSAGVVFDSGTSTADAITIKDGFVTIDWIELKGGGNNSNAIEFTSTPASNKGVVRNCLIHDRSGDGIRLTDNDAINDVYNNIIYAVDQGIRITQPSSGTVHILNNTVYACTNGVSAGSGSFGNVILQNNIAHSSSASDYSVPGRNAASRNNLSSDATASAHNPANTTPPPNQWDLVPLASMKFAPGSLHIQSGSAAEGQGFDDATLRAIVHLDIDGALRATPYDMGADEIAATTVVELLSFEGRGGDGAVELTWETATEVNNLGFYLYRAVSENGPFERITPALMPGLGSSPVGARYRYVDSGLTNGTTYYYTLEDLETTGTRTKHGPVSVTPNAGASLTTPFSPSVPSSSASIIYGKPEESSLRVLASDPTGVTLELVTAGFYAEPQPEGTVRLSVPGFVDERGSIPVKRQWLSAVVGRKVRIRSVRATELSAFSPLRPTESGIPEVIAVRGVVEAGVRRVGASARGSAQDWARLVSVAFQGDVKKALVELSPLRWDGSRLVLARRLVVRVAFAGRDLEEMSLGGSRGRRARELASHRRGAASLRLRVRERRVYGLSYEEVQAALGRQAPLGKLGLSRQGRPVAFHIVNRTGRHFGPGSVLYFVSEGASLNPYGDAAVYELRVGEEGLKMPVTDAKPWGSPRGWYWQRVEREENHIYQPVLLDAVEPWLWDTLLSPVLKTYPFSVTALAAAGEPARVELWLQGASDFASNPDHHARVYVNGTLVSETLWDGKRPVKLEAEFDAGVLVEGANQLSVENVGDTEATSSMVMLERFSVVYPRLAVADGGVLEGRWGESGAAELKGLSGPAIVVDVSEQTPRWLTGVETNGSGVRFRGTSGRTYLAVGAGAVRKAELARPVTSALKNERNRAEYLVLGPAELLAEAAPLLNLRRSQGLSSKAVPIEEVYSEFGFGEERPEAIREFLAYAYQHWSAPSPRYVLLLGDATYDFKDYLKTGVKNQVPPLMMKTSYWWTASDPSYATVNGDDELPDLSIGRLPAGTKEEARTLVSKILAYEARDKRLEGRAVVVVDNPDRGGDFEADAEDIATGVLAGREVETIRVSERGRKGTRAGIREAFDRGASLMSYVGHGAILVWASENVFNIMDVKSLSPQEEQPFLLTMNCLNGYFHFPYLNSLSEALLKEEGRGVIGAFSPSGLSLSGPAHHYHKALLSELVSGKWERLGDAVLAAQDEFAARGEFLELLSIYHLLADPAMRLR